MITTQLTNTKFLGVLINDNLTWTDHIFTVFNKTSKNLGIIRKLSNTLPNDVLHTLYNTLIAQYLSYCNIAWGTSDSRMVNTLFEVKKTICIVTVVAGMSTLLLYLNLHLH